MMWAEVRKNWLPLSDQMRKKWNKLSVDDVAAIGGRRRQLIAFLCLHYELDEPTAACQADAFVNALQVLSL